MIYCGYDPGGANAFGWAVVWFGADNSVASLKSGLARNASDAVGLVSEAIGSYEPQGIGIDAPLYWSLDGARAADTFVRQRVVLGGGHSATVGATNSLQGACLVQGILTALMAKAMWPGIVVTECHPKALRHCGELAMEMLKFDNHAFKNEHERDAAVAAYCARAAHLRADKWVDLMQYEDRARLHFPAGEEVVYFFPGSFLAKVFKHSQCSDPWLPRDPNLKARVGRLRPD